MRNINKLFVLIIFLIAVNVVYSSEGGPDEYGYRWIDSNEPHGPEFNWIEISETGTNLLLGDDTYSYLTATMPFNFYGIDYYYIYVSANGWISFSDVGYYITVGPFPPISTQAHSQPSFLQATLQELKAGWSDPHVSPRHEHRPRTVVKAPTAVVLAALLPEPIRRQLAGAERTERGHGGERTEGRRGGKSGDRLPEIGYDVVVVVGGECPHFLGRENPAEDYGLVDVASKPVERNISAGDNPRRATCNI